MKMLMGVISAVLVLAPVLVQRVEGSIPITVVSNGASAAVIVMGNAVSTVETNVICLLRDKIAEKTGAAVTIVGESGFNIDTAPYVSVILPGTSSGNALLASEMARARFEFPSASEAYMVSTGTHGTKNVVLIAGADTAGVLYGVGKFLRQADYRASDGMTFASPLNIASSPLDDSRGPYFAIHCANWYESIGDTEKLSDLVKEQALWGANIIYVWFDMSMYRKGPFAPASDSAVKWNRIKTIAAAAQRIGVKLGLVEIYNAGYLGQTEGSPLRAVNGEPPEGLFCPNAQSQAARPIMEQNYRELYGDLVASGIDLAAVVQALYDRGGCKCRACSPWIQTAVGKLGPWHDGIVRGYFPEVKDYLCDWHFSDTEVGWVKNYLATNQPAWMKGVFRDDRHAWDRWSGIPAQYRVRAFLDITMIGGWSGYGANPFPGRLDHVFAGMRTNGIRGGMAYSEGLFDDLNKAVYLQKHWGNGSSADIIREYSKWYFNADAARQEVIATMAGNMEREWGNILASWSGQNLTLNVTNDISGQLDVIETGLSTAATNTWRWKLIHARAYLAKECSDISALQGSGYAGFCARMDALLTAGNRALAETALAEQKAWLTQRQAGYAAELKTLYASVYEGTKSGMYDQSGPNPPRWMKGYNSGTVWNNKFNDYQSQLSSTGIPVLISADAGNGQVTLSFSSVPGATEYKIKYGSAAGSCSTVISGVTGSPFTVTGLTNGIPQYFRVSAVVRNVEKANSPPISSVPKKGVPNAVTLISAVVKDGVVVLHFTTDKSATSYKVKYDIDSMHNKVITGVKGSPFSVAGLIKGTTYYFVVAGTNEEGDSVDSNEKKVGL